MFSRLPEDRSIAAEAVNWIARLQRPDRNAGLEHAFRKWLRSDPEHAAAFEEATTLWNDLPGIGGMFREQAQRRRRWPRIAAAAAVILLAGSALLFQFSSGDVFSTAIGEQRLVKLEDGSWMSMNTDTVVRVRYGASRRYVVLERGEALFDVSKDANRPFVVAADDEEVRAVGTSFVVRKDASIVAVTLLEGRVKVESPVRPWGADKVARVEMVAGQSWRSQDNALTTLTPADLDALTAWRRGELVFDATSLRDAVAEMNRYNDKPLVILAPAAGSLPVSGVFNIRGSAEFAQTVAVVHGLNVVVEDKRILLSLAPAGG